MLIFYLIEINIVDLLHLTEIKNGNIEYRRANTGRLYTIKILPEAQAIFEKYKGKNYLLDVLDRYKDYRISSRMLNNNLKQIGSFDTKKGIYKPIVPELTAYSAHHSWATIAQTKCGASTELVGFCLNHVSAHRITEGYIKKTFDPIDKLNKEVTDFIFAEKEDAQQINFARQPI